MKTCTKCNISKSVEGYHKDKSTKDGRYPSCIKCNMHKRGDKVKKAIYDRAYRKTIGLKKVASRLKTPVIILNNTYHKQNGLCAICKNPETVIRSDSTPVRLAADHDHLTKAFRGFLCANCNRGLGMFKDNITYLESAIVYLVGKL